MIQLFVDNRPFVENPELILLDKDGTLIDIHHYWSSMIQIRSRTICERWLEGVENRTSIENHLADSMGVELETGRMKPEGPVGVKPRSFIVNVAVNVLRDAGIAIKHTAMESLFQDVDQATAKDMLPLLRLLPGVTEFLERARECDVDLAVVSTDITERVNKSMEALGIDGYFKTTLGGDAVENPKPAPDLVDVVLQQGHYSKTKVVIIGDHPVDIQMGINAGIEKNIGVLTGLTKSEGFQPYPCTVIEDLSSLELRS